MAIGNRTATDVNADLRNTDTTELRFRNAIMQTVDQVDANEVDIAATRTISLTGDVTGTQTFELDAGRNISIPTTIEALSISGGDIMNNTITNTQIQAGTIRNTEIEVGTIQQDRIDPTDKVRIRVLAADGSTLRQFDGLSVT